MRTRCSHNDRSKRDIILAIILVLRGLCRQCLCLIPKFILTVPPKRRLLFLLVSTVINFVIFAANHLHSGKGLTIHSSNLSRDGSLENAVPSTEELTVLATEHPIVEANLIQLVVAHCHDNLSWLDRFDSCNGIEIHIYSKCNDDERIPTFVKVADCVTIYSGIENCGREEYAFFKHVVDNYDKLPPMVAFLQGSSITENPHIVHDVMSYLPGTRFKDLSRHIRSAWHFPAYANSTDQNGIQEKTSPIVYQQKTWVTSWRSMFLASRTELHTLSKALYIEHNELFCSNKCTASNCNIEVWFAPLFKCTPVLFKGTDCETRKFKAAPLGVDEDLVKDANFHFKKKRALPKMKSVTTQITCGNRTLFYMESKANGVLMCVDDSKLDWEEELKTMYKEDVQSLNLSGLEWGAITLNPAD